MHTTTAVLYAAPTPLQKPDGHPLLPRDNCEEPFILPVHTSRPAAVTAVATSANRDLITPQTYINIIYICIYLLRPWNVCIHVKTNISRSYV